MPDLWEIKQLIEAGVKLDCCGNPDTPERQALAAANAQAWIDSPYRKQLRASVERQIAANREARRESLWYMIQNGNG